VAEARGNRAATHATTGYDPIGGIVDAVVDDIIGDVAPGATVTRRPFVYATSSRLEEIEVTRPGWQPVRLVAKYLGRHSMSEAAQLAKAGAPHSAGRELAVYQHILTGAGLGTPALVGGWAGDGTGSETGNGVVVLERVEGTPLAEIGDFGVWKAAARWLARMHAQFAAAPPRIPATGPGPHSALAYYGRDVLGTSARRGLERAAEQALGPPEVLVALRTRHEYALRALASAAPTLVHGDFYPSNIVVSGDRIAVVDWELAGIGPAVLDLAALAAGGWSSEQRHDLFRAYHEEALARGRMETFTALVRRVELASVNLALRWVGAPQEWEAPDEHHRDWFADAVAALARLDRGLP
jgi:aminoglycoside phosphotransferase (APT) family kinase protein